MSAIINMVREAVASITRPAVAYSKKFDNDDDDGRYDLPGNTRPGGGGGAQHHHFHKHLHGQHTSLNGLQSAQGTRIVMSDQQALDFDSFSLDISVDERIRLIYDGLLRGAKQVRKSSMTAYGMFMSVTDTGQVIVWMNSDHLYMDIIRHNMRTQPSFAQCIVYKDFLAGMGMRGVPMPYVESVVAVVWTEFLKADFEIYDEDGRRINTIMQLAADKLEEEERLLQTRDNDDDGEGGGDTVPLYEHHDAPCLQPSLHPPDSPFPPDVTVVIDNREPDVVVVRSFSPQPETSKNK